MGSGVYIVLSTRLLHFLLSHTRGFSHIVKISLCEISPEFPQGSLNPQVFPGVLKTSEFPWVDLISGRSKRNIELITLLILGLGLIVNYLLIFGTLNSFLNMRKIKNSSSMLTMTKIYLSKKLFFEPSFLPLINSNFYKEFFVSDNF